mmetsp:Transcript_34323/g.97228  ORF Transcript_34323/g.97228 Transcript_34323/m.97228 type:complete len:248 (+) Transcript_34323:768-1511(+)
MHVLGDAFVDLRVGQTVKAIPPLLRRGRVPLRLVIRPHQVADSVMLQCKAEVNVLHAVGVRCFPGQVVTRHVVCEHVLGADCEAEDGGPPVSGAALPGDHQLRDTLVVVAVVPLLELAARVDAAVADPFHHVNDEELHPRGSSLGEPFQVQSEGARQLQDPAHPLVLEDARRRVWNHSLVVLAAAWQVVEHPAVAAHCRASSSHQARCCSIIQQLCRQDDKQAELAGKWSPSAHCPAASTCAQPRLP